MPTATAFSTGTRLTDSRMGTEVDSLVCLLRASNIYVVLELPRTHTAILGL